MSNHESIQRSHTSRNPLPPTALATLLGIALLALSASAADTFRGSQFIRIKNVSAFEKTKGSHPGEIILTSSEIISGIKFDELIGSWNADMPDSTYLKLEVRALYLDRRTKYYTLALWSPNPSLHPRESVLSQKDDDGDVATDTLKLKDPALGFQIRLTLGSDDNRVAKTKLLGFSVTDTKANPPVLAPNRLAWGRSIPVPERSQMAYPNGKVLCSPTTVSMLLDWWSQKLKRPELDRDVPEVAAGVFDTNWKGTGNWPFNTAYAGAQPGLRAYVTRLSDVSELEDWIARGIPVGLSLCYDRLRGKEGGPTNGHLVVCVGFTGEGDVILNDPGTSHNVRKTFARKNLITAWARSRNAVYLIYPENVEIPTDRFAHWDSWSARQRANLN